jgi:hypothetical protein
MTSRRITALFTLLAILIAPLCAPFCHSHVCAALPSEHNDGCHSSAVASDNIRHLDIAAFHVCGGQELPAAALNETTNSPELVRLQYAVHATLNLAPPLSVLLASNSASPPHPDGETRIESGSVRPSILRI